MSVRIKQGYYYSVINSINIVSKNAVRTLLLQLISGGTLNNPSWTQPTSTDASETAMEVDSTSRIVTGGNIVWQAFSRDATWLVE
jgi:hypothetical protein